MEKVFNVEKALKHTMNDRSLLVDLLRFTLEDVPDMLSRLEEALKKEESPRIIAEWAHKIKGSAGAVSAEKLFSSAFELEVTAQEEEDDNYEELYLLMRESFNEFREDENVQSFIGE
ncbi:MAG: Hpt domain-containing protein [Spirochaetales bacterium]|nr:Hpt domain-containing protein [Spirochaetales bacterium]